MSSIDRAVAWNRSNATPVGDLAPTPRLGLAVVTCMDARVHPERIIGIEPGDAHVIRNAGGIVDDDVLRSLVVSQVALGTREVMVIQHTDCGLLGLDEEVFASKVEAERGVRPGFSAGGFADLHDRVARSLRRLRATPYLVGRFRGFVFEVETGLLHEIEP